MSVIHSLPIEPALARSPDSATGPSPEPPPEIDPSALDAEAVKVVLRLKRHGHEAYFVGGCVRDLLLGRAPKDFDVATSAHPGAVKALFSNCRLIGRRFRLAHVYFKGGKIIEVSTFRASPADIEDLAPEGQGPTERGAEIPGPSSGADEDLEGERADLLITEDNVFGTAEQDARRRDFTINGLFYDVSLGRVIDFVDGRRDLRAQLIRTIGDPEVRMREDPVRILRAIRFACKLKFDIESATYAAMEGTAEELPRCAPARLLEETFRLLRAGVAGPSLRLLNALDALKFLLPPLHAYLHDGGAHAEQEFYALADALDRVMAREPPEKGPPEDAILLASLLSPMSSPKEQDEGEARRRGRAVTSPVIDALLHQLTHSARLPKRISQRCRMILAVQPMLSAERQRRGGLQRLRRYPLFEEALKVFEVRVEATGKLRDVLEVWKGGGVPNIEHPATEAPSPRRRRRRRRRARAGGARSP